MQKATQAMATTMRTARRKRKNGLVFSALNLPSLELRASIARPG